MSLWENPFSYSSPSSSDDSDSEPDRRVLAPSPPPPSSRPASNGITLKLGASGTAKIILKPPKPPSYSLGSSNNINYSQPSSSRVTKLDDADILSTDEEPTAGPSQATTSLSPAKAVKKAKPPKAKFGHARKDKSKRRDGPKGPPRPQKLKPLKEVLQRLIGMVSKKDSYGFFLRPVDPAAVPGYADVIKQPMDFSTMETKVNKGRYRTLEEFLADFQLTLNNAKTFNPPGTMYHSEATRILTWGTDFILRAAPTVLLHHNEWSFDDPGGEVDIEGEGSASRFASVVPEDTAMDTTEADAQYAASLAGEGPGPSLRRGVRGPPPPKKSLPASKADAGVVTGTEEFQASDGHLPGFADGISLFPAQSEFAHLAIHLKRHGYKYKTKKERLRVEKEGAPLAADGSRDIWHYEDPISLLEGIMERHDPVKDPVRTPWLTPITTPLGPASNLQATPSQTRAGTPAASTSQATTPAPGARAASMVPDIPILPFYPSSSTNASLENLSSEPPLSLPPNPKINGKRVRSHWTLRQTSQKRAKADEVDRDSESPPWKVPRLARPRDWGSFALLGGPSVHPPPPSVFASAQLSPENLDHALYHQGLRDSLDCEAGLFVPRDEPGIGPQSKLWSIARANHAEEYLRDMVYGGVDGYAYTQSIAQFLAPSEFEPSSTFDADPVLKWLNEAVFDPLSEGHHSVLRQTLQDLNDPITPPKLKHTITLLSEAFNHYTEIQEIGKGNVDMGELITSVEELWESENVLRHFRIRLHARDLAASSGEVKTFDPSTLTKAESADELHAALLDNGAVLERVALRARQRERDVKMEDGTDTKMDVDDVAVTPPATEEELRALRLNLLALAKRAPIDRIVRFPKELVPTNFQHLIH